jgi:hypothetical protein
MNRLEDQLTSAAEEARRQVSHLQARPAPGVRTRMHRHRALTGAAVAAGVFGLLGATAVIANYEAPTSGFAAAPTTSATAAAPSTTIADPSSATTVAGATVSTTAPVGTITDQPGLPRFGFVSDDWTIVDAREDPAGSGNMLLYEGNPEVYGGLARIGIESVAEFPGNEPGTGYSHTLSALEANETPLDDVTLGFGAIARAFTFTDSNSGGTGYYFLWQHSDTIAVHVIAYVDDYEDAAAVVTSMAPLPESDG